MQSPITFSRSQQGFTITELMIALVLGLLVVLAATAMILTSRSTYRTQDESTRLQENARFAIELMSRSIRLAGYTNFGDSVTSNTAPPVFDNAFDRNVTGTDAETGAPNNSDSLTIRYFGVNNPASGTPDGTMLDCAGIVSGEPTPSATSYNTDRILNTFDVRNSALDGEPELRCTRRNNTAGTTSTASLIRGVESFQVLYGVSLYGTGEDPEVDYPSNIVYLPANQMNAARGDWCNINSLRISMLLRSDRNARSGLDGNSYQLFGDSYTNTADAGRSFNASSLSTAERTRLRRVVSTTVFLRNRICAWPTS